jgi:SAM-dependent methyltransferase
MGELIQIDRTGWTDKDSLRPEYRELYETLPFIEAYAKHTDLRIAKDGPELAIGAKRDGQQDWDKHGLMQLNFLKARGLKPEHMLLDFGCGTGRLACQAVPYMEKGHYVGMDISEQAIWHCNHRDYAGKPPLFLQTLDGRLPADKGWKFHYIFSHSVMTHLPPEAVEAIFADLCMMDFQQYFFTFKPASENRRSGLKQFQYSYKWLIETGVKYNLRVRKDEMEWPAGQKTMRVTRA